MSLFRGGMVASFSLFARGGKSFICLHACLLPQYTVLWLTIMTTDNYDDASCLFDIRQLMEEVVCQVDAEHVKNNGVDLAYTVAQNVPEHWQGKAKILRQILTTLLRNGLQHTSVGTVSLELRLDCEDDQEDENDDSSSTTRRQTRDNPRTSLTEQSMQQLSSGMPQPAADVTLKFEIVDTGAGMSSKRRKALFSSPPANPEQGTYSLGRVQAWVSSINGHVTVKSRRHRGTTFTVTAPFVPVVDTAGPQWRDEISALDLALLRQARVLVMDASALTMEYLVHVLTAAGARAEGTRCSQKGQEMVQTAASLNDPYDMVLVDHDMPGRTSGLEIALLRRASTTMRVVLLGQNSLPKRIPGPEIHAFYRKPIQRLSILRIILEQLKAKSETKPEESSSLGSDDTIATTESRQKFADVQRRPSVLLVEDNAITQKIMVRSLTEMNVDVVVASNGATGYEQRMSGDFDLVLCDLHMPNEYDGLQFLENVRHWEKKHGTKPVPICAVTADDGARAKCLAAGFDAFLCKPMRRDALQTIMQKFLNQVSVHTISSSPLTDRTSSMVLPTLTPMQLRLSQTTMNEQLEMQSGMFNLSFSVLIIEDNMVNQKVIINLLQKLRPGLSIVTAKNGVEGFESRISSGPFDIVLCDLHMPLCDGFECVKKIRQWEKDKGVASLHICALTADSNPDTRERCLAGGFDVFATKPLRKNILQDVLDRVKKIHSEPESVGRTYSRNFTGLLEVQ